ncbi:hypothetical protein ACOI9F_13865, partial [Corynebacterium striatum]
MHTAGGFNPECNDGKGRPMWHTNIVSRIPWIKETMQSNSSFTDQEKAKSNTGLKHAATLFPDVSNPKNPHNDSSPEKSSFSLSEVPRVLFLGLCLVFHYFSTGVVFPKIGFYFSRRAVAQALVE